MTLVAALLAAVLAVACVVWVARPFLEEPETADDRLDELDSAERRRAALAEERDRALAALKELEFENRTGAISDEDYRSLVGPLRREAAAALHALDRARGRPEPERLRPSRNGHRSGMSEIGQPEPPAPQPAPPPYAPDEGTPAPTPVPVPDRPDDPARD